jgi:hypothetical protein
LGREKALNVQGAFVRLQSSAISGYWHGRVSRAYLASMMWNLKRKNIFTAVSRAMAGFAFAGQYIFLPGFWRGLKTKIK